MIEEATEVTVVVSEAVIEAISEEVTAEHTEAAEIEGDTEAVLTAEVEISEEMMNNHHREKAP